MQDGIVGSGASPDAGATRFAADGTLEVFDGRAWAPYQPVTDDPYGPVVVFKGIVPPSEPTDEADDTASETQ